VGESDYDLVVAPPHLRGAGVTYQRAVGHRGRLVFRKTLVVVQVALALVLLIGAGLFTRTLATLRAQGPGYSTSKLLTFKIDPMGAGHGVSERSL
jgi:hypothetical protein